MKKFLSEFKEFAVKGSVIDMAIGVIVGAAFKTIIDSLVGDIISPLLGLLTGKDFSENAFMIGDVAVGYGAFITSVLNFFIIAIVLFILVKAINKLRALREPKVAAVPEAPTTKLCPFCKTEIPIDALRCPHCTSELK